MRIAAEGWSALWTSYPDAERINDVMHYLARLDSGSPPMLSRHDQEHPCLFTIA